LVVAVRDVYLSNATLDAIVRMVELQYANVVWSKEWFVGVSWNIAREEDIGRPKVSVFKKLQLRTFHHGEVEVRD
jgi:hypothetical protein